VLTKTLFFVVLPVLLVLLLFLGRQRAIFATAEINYNGINTNLSGDDNVAGPFPLGFNFTYYGNTYTQGSTSTNGDFSFISNTRRGFTNTSLSDPEYVDPFQDPNFPFDMSDNQGPWLNMLYPFWDDLITQGAVTPPYTQKPTIYYTTIGTAPHRQFIMQWTNMYFYNQPDLPMGTFQMILDEGTNVIHFQYRDLLGGAASLGDSATVGIKGNDDTQYSQVSFNTASLTQGQAITFTPDGDTSYTVDTSASYLPVYVLPEGVPASPLVINPTDGLMGAIATPTFEWGPVDLATSYSLLISDTPDFSSTIVNQTGLTDTTYTLGSPLDYSTTYYWKVAAVNDLGSSFSVTRSFTTAAQSFPVPGISQLSGGALLAGGRVSAATLHSTPIKMQLTDSDHTQQLRYRLQVASDPDFNTVVLDYRSPYDTEGGTRSFIVASASGGTYLVGSNATDLTDGQDYYVRLVAEDQHAQSSAWAGSSSVAFIYDTAAPTAPEAPSLEGAASKSATKLTWIASNDEYPAVPFYRLDYSTDANFSNLNTVSTSSTSATLVNLSSGTYYARLRTVDSAGNISQPSTVLTFVVPNPPTATSSNPVNNAVTTTAQTSPEAATSLVIHIVDSKNHPIKGALVTLHSVIRTAYTDDQGNATFTNVSAGTHSVIAEYGYMHAQTSVEVAPASTTSPEAEVVNVFLQLKQPAATTTRRAISSRLNTRYWVAGSIAAVLLFSVAIVKKYKK